MSWRKAAILITALVLAATPGAAAPAAATNQAAKAKPIGHPPHPFQDIGRIDLFHGYRCGGADCLLHQQGYQWGADHKVVNPNDCRGASEEFIEGCRAFAGVEGPLGHKEFDPSFPHMVGID